MRDLLLRLLTIFLRALRPPGKRRFRALTPGSTVLYTQYERPLGCCVHGTPLIEALRATAPGVRIVVASHGSGAATLRHHPGVYALIETGTEPLGSLSAVWRTAKEVRHALRERGIRPDVVVLDASSRRPISALFAGLLRLAPTVGFAKAPALLDRYLAYDPTLSLIDNNLRLPLALGGAEAHLEPAVYFAETDLQLVRQLLEQLPSTRTGRVGFVLQGSGGQRTGWHDARFAEVIGAVEADGYATVYLGTAADRDGIERIRTLAGSKGLSLAGLTTIPQAAATLCLCDLLITLDTGTMHLGRAVGVPMVVLGPSWQPPLEWLPLGLEQVRILRGPDRADMPEFYHLDEIGVPEVLRAARELLQIFPPSEIARERRVMERLSKQAAE